MRKLIAMLVLCVAVGASAVTVPADTQRVVYAKPETNWKFKLIAEGHPTLPDVISAANCGRPRSVAVSPLGAAVVNDFPALLCGELAINVLDTGSSAATVYSEGEYLPTGQTYYFPAATLPVVGFNAEYRIASIENTDETPTNLAIVNETEMPARFTLVVFDGAAAEIGREYLNVPAYGFLYYRLSTSVAVGSAILKPGCHSVGFGFAGCNTPSSATDGPIWGWYTVGARAGALGKRFTTAQ